MVGSSCFSAGRQRTGSALAAIALAPLLAGVAARAGIPYETFLGLRWKLKK